MPGFERRHRLARALAGGALLVSATATQSPALAGVLHRHVGSSARDDSWGDLGYYDDYGGYYDPYASYTYDPGASCYGVVCDGGFSDPATNFMYDATEEQEAVAEDSADAFDQYILEQQPVAGGAAAPLVAGSAAFKALGRTLLRLTAAPTAAAGATGASHSLAAVRAGGNRHGARGGRLRVAMPAFQSRPSGAHLLRSAAPRSASPVTGLAAARIAVFVDAQRTYKIDYPGDWTMVNHDQYVRGAYVDVRLIAPDANAGVVGQSLTLPAGLSFSLEDPAVQNYLAGAIQFAAFGAQPTARPELQAFTIPSGDEILVGRVPFQWVDPSLAPSQFPSVSAGMQGGVLFVALHNNGRLYLVTGTIADLAAASAAADARQLSAIFSSLDLLHIYKPAGKPNAVVDATRTYRLAFPSTWSYTKNVPAGDTALVSNDHTSAVVALAQPAPAGMRQISPSYMHSMITSLGSTLGRVTQAPAFHKVVAGTSTRYAATVQFRRQDGKTGKALIVATMHKREVCAVVGIAMDHGASSIRQQAQQASYIVSSLHLQ